MKRFYPSFCCSKNPARQVGSSLGPEQKTLFRKIEKVSWGCGPWRVSLFGIFICHDLVRGVLDAGNQINYEDFSENHQDASAKSRNRSNSQIAGSDCISALPKRDRSRVVFHGIDAEPKAIETARDRISATGTEKTIRIENANVIRFHIRERYDLIWSAGLFDYFGDSLFRRVLQRFLGFLNPGGEIVIGNFSESNQSRIYMEAFGDWVLHHRSATALRQLASGFRQSSKAVWVDSEKEGINLFLHLGAKCARATRDSPGQLVPALAVS